MPVPAGMSLPMMTFSFSPSSESDLAWIAASVSTLVVSWNEAADSHEPRPLHQLAGQQLGVARLKHVHPLQHLPDDDLDVLVVDGDALGPVDLLHLVHQVQLDLAGTEDPEPLVL